MRKQILEKFAGASTAEELRLRIESMCESFGRIENCSLLPTDHAHEWIGFVEFKASNPNKLAIDLLGGFAFGNGIAFIVRYELPVAAKEELHQ